MFEVKSPVTQTRDAVQQLIRYHNHGQQPVMDKEMAAVVHDRLAKMDEAIELMQDLRKETVELFAELFPGECQKDLFSFEEAV